MAMTEIDSALRPILPLTAAVDGAGHLVVGGCDTVELAKEFGTPLYVFDEEDLRARCREFRREFKFVVSVVIFRDNYRQLPEMVEMLGYIFGADIDFIDFFPIKEYEDLFLTANDVRRLEEEILPELEIRLAQLEFPSAARKLREILEGDPTQGVYGEMPERCYSSHTSLYVCGRERKVYPCGYMADFAERHPEDAVALGDVGSELDYEKLKALPLPVCRKLCGPIVKGHNRRAGKAIEIMRGFTDLPEVLTRPYAENILLLRLHEVYGAMRRNLGGQRM